MKRSDLQGMTAANLSGLLLISRDFNVLLPTPWHPTNAIVLRLSGGILVTSSYRESSALSNSVLCFVSYIFFCFFFEIWARLEDIEILTNIYLGLRLKILQTVYTEHSRYCVSQSLEPREKRFRIMGWQDKQDLEFSVSEQVFVQFSVNANQWFTSSSVTM